MPDPIRLAVVISHPIQYYSPWFRHLAQLAEIELKVFYLWDFGIEEKKDDKFGTSFQWDIPLLDGYTHDFVPNVSPDPGTHHFKGLDNPDLNPRLSSWDPDQILLFGYNYATHLRLILSPSLRKVPLIFRGDSHNLFPVGGLKSKISQLLRRLVFKRFHQFLAVGSANEDYFRSCGVPEAKITRAYHCVDNQRFSSALLEAEKAAEIWKQELGIPEQSFVFLAAGKFETKKRPLDLLKAFQNLDLENTCLLFVGGGEHEKTLRELAGHDVYFAPFQNQSQMPRTYAAGNVVVLPSFGRGETWGLAVNEAMNLKRPAIVSSHVGCGPDLILPNQTGWIFEAGDIASLTRTMKLAAEDPNHTREMGILAQQHVTTFSYEGAAEALLKALRK